MSSPDPRADDPLGILCGGGTLPFQVADAVLRSGRPVVLYAMTGIADPARVAGYAHRWGKLGQWGRFVRLARGDRCRDIVWIGTVARPPLSRIAFDLGVVKLLPRLVAAFRGGDDHLLTHLARMFEEYGFRLVAAHEVAPEILVPEGVLGRHRPGERDRSDIARGLALLRATAPFDIGQAVVVADNHVIAIEGAEGTDRMLERVAELRRLGCGGARGGVLVKAPKSQQDRRFDLPSIGPRTIEAATRAGLSGIGVIAGATIVADAEHLILAADRHGIFVTGLADDGTAR